VSHVTKTVCTQRLLRRTVLGMKCPPVRSPVADDVSCSDAAGLWKCHPRRHPAVSAQATSVGDNSAARLVFSSSRYDHITPLLCQLHWLKARERINFKLALLVYTCQHGAAPSYLVDKLNQPADFEARRRLHSASSSSLTVHRTRLLTIGD